MRGLSFRSKYQTLALVTFLVARICFASALPRHEYQAKPNAKTLLLFGQSVALADFDGDNRIDKATLGGNGRNKSIEIRLSYARTPTFLHFDTVSAEQGSLFAADIDHDGDDDLIWSDLLHPEDVVIWVDDGSGRFGRLCPDTYAEAFVLSDAPALADLEIPHQDFAFSSGHDPLRSLPTGRLSLRLARTPILRGEPTQAVVDSSSLRATFDRGPPFPLS